MRFSILIPAYKRQFLQECIESILVQTYRDFEIIIVNDASPEDLDSIVNSFTDFRIRYYVNEKNCGAVNVVDNWNKCLEYATGDYIICMGDDDKLLPNCLEEYNKLIERYPGLGVYHAWTEIIDENSIVVKMQEARPEREGVYSMMWGRLDGRIQFIGDFLFDRILLLQNGGFFKLPLAWASDDISVYIAAKNTGIANMQIPGFQYRVNSQTISSKGNVQLKLYAISKEERWYEDFLSRNFSGSDKVEYVFRCMLQKALPYKIIKKRVHTLTVCMINEGLGMFWMFLRKRKDLNLNFKIIGYAMIETVKRRVSKSYNITKG